MPFPGSRTLGLVCTLSAIFLVASSVARADWAYQFEMKQQIGDCPSGAAVLSEPSPSGGTELLLTVNTDIIGQKRSFHAFADPGLIA